MLPKSHVMYSGDFNRDKYLYVLEIESDLGMSFGDLFLKSMTNRPTGLIVVVHRTGEKEVAGAENIRLRKGDIIAVKCVDPEVAKNLCEKLNAKMLSIKVLEEMNLLHVIYMEEGSPIIGQSPEDKSSGSVDNVRFLAWANGGEPSYLNVGSHKIQAHTTFG